jgi:hypothetical protein
VRGRRGRRRGKLLDDLKERRGSLSSTTFQNLSGISDLLPAYGKLNTMWGRLADNVVSRCAY